MEKVVILKDNVLDSNGNVVAEMVTRLEGDGATPLVQTTGPAEVLGFNDDGTPIVNMSEEHDKLIESAQKDFMSEAIKEQKKLCVENGVDPSLVNVIDAEKKEA